MKCKVHYVSPKGSAEMIAEVFARESKCVKEPLLPAYMPEGVHLMFLGCENKADNVTLEFIDTLNKDRVKNCALFCCAKNSDAAISAMREALSRRGINVLPTAFTAPVKGLFNKGPSESDLQRAKKFAQDSMAQVAQ
ncbi:MAG: hypothetical protein ACOYI8_02735 [Christensenellales bacterium]|jgi:hypothetical protein